MHYTGKDAETITLSGTIYPLYPRANPAGALQLDALRELADEGEPFQLGGNRVPGEGENLGAWCIRSISEEQTEFLPGGAPRKQSFTITLVRYHKDGGAKQPSSRNTGVV